MAVLFPKQDSVKQTRICPKCGSSNVRTSKITYLADPLKIEGLVGWDCLNCKYTSKDFIVGDEIAVEEYRKNLKKK